MKCWICETVYEGDECPECGPPQPWGPTPDELEVYACGVCGEEHITPRDMDDSELYGEPEPRVDPQTGFVE